MKSLDDCENIALGNDGVGRAVEGHFRATVFGDENLVVHRDAEGDGLAIFVAAAGTDGAHDGFLRLLLGGIRQEESAGGFAFSFDALHEHTLSDGFNHGLIDVFG